MMPAENLGPLLIFKYKNEAKQNKEIKKKYLQK